MSVSDMILCHECGHDIDNHDLGECCDCPGSGRGCHQWTSDIARAALEAVKEDMRRDEYHTMDELYEYRMLYNALAANALAHLAVKSWRHSDGELCFGGGWFVVYLNLPTGQVSNHYKAEHWDLFNVPEEDTAPEYDGHTPAEAAERLKAAAPALEAVYADIKAKAEAWDEGAEAAWERSAPEVNGQTHHWRHEGEPLNPYRDDRIEPRGTNE